FPLVVGLGVGPMLDVEDRDAAGAEPRSTVGALDHIEPEHVAVIARKLVEVARDQPDAADMQRRAARKGGYGGGIRCVHERYIGVLGGRHNGPATGPVWLPAGTPLCYSARSISVFPALFARPHVRRRRHGPPYRASRAHCGCR